MMPTAVIFLVGFVTGWTLRSCLGFPVDPIRDELKARLMIEGRTERDAEDYLKVVYDEQPH